MSALHIERLPLEGLALIRTPIRSDARGSFCETYNQRDFAEAIGHVSFVQDNESRSVKRGTVRGLHFQVPPASQAKLVRVVKGAIYDVAVDLRPNSPTYRSHVGVELSVADRTLIFVPPGFAHGFCTLEDDTVVLYKTDAHYSGEHDRAIWWNDPDLGIRWPISVTEAILSDKDRQAPRLDDIAAPFVGWDG